MITSYLWISVLVGLLEIIEFIVIYKNRGWITNIVTQISIFEFIWTLVTIWVLSNIWGVADAPIWHPILYLTYVLAATIAGMFLFKNIRVGDDLSIQLPPVVAFAAGIFGVIFLLASLFALAQ